MKYKGYLIMPSKEAPQVYSIATEGRGGKIPNSLGGMYTTRAIAMSDIDRYLETKEKGNAKESVEG